MGKMYPLAATRLPKWMASAGDARKRRQRRDVGPPTHPPLGLNRAAWWAYLGLRWRGFSSATEQYLPLVVRGGQRLDVASRARVCNILDKSCNSQGCRQGVVTQEASKYNKMAAGSRSLLSVCSWIAQDGGTQGRVWTSAYAQRDGERRKEAFLPCDKGNVAPGAVHHRPPAAGAVM